MQLDDLINRLRVVVVTSCPDGEGWHGWVGKMNIKLNSTLVKI